MYLNGELVIHAGNQHLVMEPIVGGERKVHGLIPRDFTTHPVGYLGIAPPMHAVDMPLISDADWPTILAAMEVDKSRLSDIRMTGNNGGMIPSQDQNGKGYCWAHSTTGGVMLLRAVANLPYVGLSAYAIACMLKNYRDEGGWGAQSLDFITSRGVPSEALWPMRSMSRANDNPQTWENAALHKVTEGWVDLQAAQYDRKLTFQQVATLLLSRNPVTADFNWWSHSVCLMDLVSGTSHYDSGDLRAVSGKLVTFGEFDQAWMNDPVTAGYGVRLWNSWGDAWSQQGTGILTGSQAIPDSAVAPRVTVASAA